MEQRLIELAYLKAGLTISFTNERGAEGLSPIKKVFHFTRGIADYVENLNTGKDVLHETFYYSGEAEYEHTRYPSSPNEHALIEIAFQYQEGDDEEGIVSYANSVMTTDGTHVSGFNSALTRALNNSARKLNLIKEDERNFTGVELRRGLTAVISVWLYYPEFNNASKDRLININIEGIVSSLFGQTLREHLEQNPDMARSIIEKAMASRRMRNQTAQTGRD